MTKVEAIEQMKQGKKVTHMYFSKEEWTTMKGGRVHTEDGYNFEPGEWWSFRSAKCFDNDWSLFIG